MSDADEARAELLAFAERLHRARGLSRLDGTPSVGVTHDGARWWATAHLLGRVVSVPTGAWSGTDDGAAGVYGSGETPAAAVASAVNAWRIVLRGHRDDHIATAEDAAIRAREWRRICAEVGARAPPLRPSASPVGASASALATAAPVAGGASPRAQQR